MPPSVNHYLAYRVIKRGGRSIGMSYKVQSAVDYQEELIKQVQKAVLEQNWKISSDPHVHYYMDCVFYFKYRGCDANNYFKCLADAITMSNCVWIDDSQLCERVQGMFYDAENPRIEIEIRPVEYIGIFKNAAHLEKFEKRCVGCVRYARNCSILAASKIGRIKPEIKDEMCLKYKRRKKDKKEKENETEE